MKPATPLILATCGLALGGIFVAARGQHRTPAHKPAPLAAVPKPAFGDDDYIGSLLYFTRERAYPGASIDWSMYREAETTMHSDVLVPPGPTWKFLGPNNLDSPTNTSDRYQGPRTLAGRVNTAAFGRGTSIFVGSPTGGFWIGSFGSSAYTEESDGTWPTLAVSCCAVDSSGQGVYVGTGDFAGCRPSPPG
ncbi:MAG TPA: hypothetical protein VKT78_10125, partial [Fimbriimonadaceae bacterium]|nr:hypothetical protein [Fimbriimonadaceae bacterium]